MLACQRLVFCELLVLVVGAAGCFEQAPMPPATSSEDAAGDPDSIMMQQPQHLPNESTATTLETQPPVPTLGSLALGIRGQPAPDLGVDIWHNLPDGTSFDLADHRGKVVYLYGFQSWCPGCHRHGFPTLADVIEHYQDNEQVVFAAVQTTFEGFGTNTPQGAKEVADRYGLTIPIGHSGSAGQPSTVMRRYRIGGTPWTIIIDRNGIVRFNDFHIRPEAAVALIDRLLESGSSQES